MRRGTISGAAFLAGPSSRLQPPRSVRRRTMTSFGITLPDAAKPSSGPLRSSRGDSMADPAFGTGDRNDSETDVPSGGDGGFALLAALRRRSLRRSTR